MTAQHILLIDDHAMFRSGLNMVISMAMPLACVTQAASVEEVFFLSSLEVSMNEVNSFSSDCSL